MKTRKSTRPDFFRVSYVSAHVARYADVRFAHQEDAAALAIRLVDGGATRASVVAIFGGRTSEVRQFTKGA